MFWKQLWARKTLAQLLEEMKGENRLRRVLGPISLTSLGVAGIGCAMAALCYAEFAAMAPVAGSAYTYAYATLGELLAWIIGWDLVLEYALSSATVATGWSGYFQSMLGAFGLEMLRWLVTDLRSALHNPDLVAAAPHLGPIPIVFNLPALV